MLHLFPNVQNYEIENDRHKYIWVYVHWWLQTKKLLVHIFEKKREIRERGEGEKRGERQEREKREMRERETMLGRWTDCREGKGLAKLQKQHKISLLGLFTSNKYSKHINV